MEMKHIRSMILDMDGVLWRDTAPIGNLEEIFKRIADQGIKLVFATNNGTKTVDQYLEKLNDFNVTAEPWQIITSAIATADHLNNLYPDGGGVYIVGEEGLVRAFEDKGFTIRSQNVVAVVAGMDRFLTYEKLRNATLLIRSGAKFIGTNPDRTFPTPRGLEPGAGTIISALETSSDVQAKIIGKPKPNMFLQALKVLGTSPDETLTVGDRLETDIAGGQAADCLTALVLSGASSKKEADEWTPPPDLIASDLSNLLDRLY
jgi:4-nitrophenyl phosphatase